MNPKSLLNEFNLRPIKSLGQHFLSSDFKIKAMVEAAALREGQTVIEVGPGLGALTHELVKLPVNIIAIEKDPKLVQFLKERYAEYPNLEIRRGDFLEYGFEDIKEKDPCAILGNLPYYVSSPMLFHLVDHRRKITHAVLTLQREVVERLVAKPDSKDYGRLTLSFGLFADVKRLFDIRRNEFYPQPAVISATIRIQFKEKTGLPSGVSEELYSKVIKLAFGTRRKQIANALSRGDWSREQIQEALVNAKLNPQTRAEDLTKDEFIRLCLEISKLSL